MTNVLLFLGFIKVVDIFILNVGNHDISYIFLTFLMAYLLDLFQLRHTLFFICVVKIFILITYLTMITIPFIIQDFINAKLPILLLDA